MLEGKNVNLRIAEKEDIPLFTDWWNSLEVIGDYELARALLARALESMQVSASKDMQVSLLDNDSIFRNERGCRLAWSRLVDLGSIDPGSNPGSPTLRSEPDLVWGR